MKKLFGTKLLFVALLAGGVEAIDLAGGLFNPGKLTDLSGITSMPGFNLSTVKCDNILDVDYLSRISSVCGALNGIQNKLSIGFGPCAVEGSGGDCAKKSVNDFCHNLRSNLLSGEKATMAPSSSIGLSTQQSILTGGDLVMSGKKEDCSKKTKNLYSSVKYGAVTEAEVQKATTMKETQGLSVFSRGVEDARDCIKANGLAGKGTSLSKKGCVSGTGITLPSSKTTSDSDVIKTATKALHSPDSGLASQLPATEKAIAARLANCKDSSDFESCKSTQLKAGDATNTAKMADTMVANIETTSARQLKLMEDAGRGENLIVHFDDESISDLPVQIKAEYGSTAKRQMAFMTAYRYLASESSSIDKEVARIAIKKAEEASRPFYENKALDDIKRVIQ